MYRPLKLARIRSGEPDRVWLAGGKVEGHFADVDGLWHCVGSVFSPTLNYPLYAVLSTSFVYIFASKVAAR